MKKEQFRAFRKKKCLSLLQMATFLGLADEKIISHYENGELPIPESISERLAVEIFADVVELPASSREEKIDQLLEVMKRLPNNGQIMEHQIEKVVYKAQNSIIEQQYLGYDAAFWVEFHRLYLKQGKGERPYIQGALFADADGNPVAFARA
ncbi:helix-turn-helix domain-containing protein [Adhaeribacter rhizoryzae]|uniref:Helix-turn-helix domain-containing protein n=1 Tax=Adhaeribacter rhizoryzae TaxID=2607907 RepID=A0A5M6DLD5_9BACT|nr:helix-turn-helix transcriptional regulator [Adhaeribacter rhizoryzae]KAA5548357.1 helix-turn-helix domain-containing protein [Adhaeribacter rhizoryzae]